MNQTKYKQIDSFECIVEAGDDVYEGHLYSTPAPADLDMLYRTTRDVRLRMCTQIVLLSIEQGLSANVPAVSANSTRCGPYRPHLFENGRNRVKSTPTHDE